MPNHISDRKNKVIRRMLQDGIPPEAIVRATGVSVSTVRARRRELWRQDRASPVQFPNLSESRAIVRIQQILNAQLPAARRRILRFLLETSSP
jgi:hypothetical protein